MCFLCNHNFEIVHKVAMHEMDKISRKIGIGRLGNHLINTVEISESKEIPQDVMLIALCKKCGKTIRITVKKGRID